LLSKHHVWILHVSFRTTSDHNASDKQGNIKSHMPKMT